MPRFPIGPFSYLFEIGMPQLDKFTYFTQFFWSCLFLFTFYILICNDGILGISRILKLRNQLVSHRENNIRSTDPNNMEDILRKGFSTGVSYMYSSLFEVSQWCNVDLLGKRKITTFLISCFGEISIGGSFSRGMERNIFSSKSSYSTSNPGWGITCKNDIMLIHVPHGHYLCPSHHDCIT